MNEYNSKINKELEINQQNIIKQIKKSHQLLLSEFILSSIFIAAFIILIIIAGVVTDQPARVLPFVVFPLFKIFHFIRNATWYRPYYKKLITSYNEITKINLEQTEKDLAQTKVVYGLTTYVNTIYDYYGFIIEKKEEAKERENESREKYLSRLFRTRTIVDLILIVIFSVVLGIIVWLTMINFISIPWLYIAFSIVVLGLIVIGVIGYQTRSCIKNWMSIYLVLDLWGTIIEEKQNLEDFKRRIMIW